MLCHTYVGNFATVMLPSEFDCVCGEFTCLVQHVRLEMVKTWR